MTGTEIRAIDCMAQHVKYLIKQDSEGRQANFAEPCEKCPYATQCNFEWIEIMAPVMQHTKIKNILIQGEA